MSDGQRWWRLLIVAAISITLGVAVWKRIPSDRALPPLPVARTSRPDPRPPEGRRPDPPPNSPVPKRAATIFVALAAQLRGGERAQLDVEGEDGWRFHEPRLYYLEPRQVPAGIPLFVRITYSGTSWGERAEPGTIKCSAILTFVVNRRYNLWCGDQDQVVMTLLEETR